MTHTTQHLEEYTYHAILGNPHDRHPVVLWNTEKEFCFQEEEVGYFFIITNSGLM